jgi:hypothetical protein
VYEKYVPYLNRLRARGDASLKQALMANDADFDGPTSDLFLRLVGVQGLTAPEHLDDQTACEIDDDTKKRIERAWRVAWELVSADAAIWDLPERPLQVTRELFHRFGTDIGAALLLAGLPEAYAAKDGVRVLAATHQLGSNPRRRVRATAQWLLTVLGPEGRIKDDWSPAGVSFRAVVGLRLFHQVVRTALFLKKDDVVLPGKTLAQVLGGANTTAINQEDLIATRLTFSVGVFEVLEKFGITWTHEEQSSYLEAWNFIGHCLGIQDDWPNFWRIAKPPGSPRPASVEASRCLLAMIREHQWPTVKTWSPYDRTHPPAAGYDLPLPDYLAELQPGRELVNALLDELSDAMLPAARRWPRAVMEMLSPQVVVDRLGLGAPGLPLSFLRHLPPIPRTIGPFTRISKQNPVSGATLRFMANEVARRAVVSFLDASKHAPFVLPGLEEWSSGIRPG